MKLNIMISGTGGQGIVAAGSFLSHALFAAGYEVMFSRSYGAEARGGSCKAVIMVSDEPINDLQFEESDVLMCLSYPAYVKYLPMARKGSLVLVDSQVYERAGSPRGDVKVVSVPARELALSLGDQIVANMVLLGALARLSDVVSLQLLSEAVDSHMRESMREINQRALRLGYEAVLDPP